MLKTFLLFPILLFSNEVFTLPQEADYFINSYTKSLLQTQKEVYVFSQSIDDYSVLQALKKLSKKDVQIYIISKDIYVQTNKVSYLNLLKGVHLYTLAKAKEKSLKGSYTCIDNKLLYISTGSLNHHSLITDHSFVIAQENSCKAIFTELLKLCTKIK
ncbi:MAG: hypothetical protein COA44_07020 [Arcobacter sp.]|nr:MAG: hypothetical protein COA44_07020 [Arcobacter sp.]